MTAREECSCSLSPSNQTKQMRNRETSSRLVLAETWRFFPRDGFCWTGTDVFSFFLFLVVSGSVRQSMMAQIT